MLLRQAYLQNQLLIVCRDEGSAKRYLHLYVAPTQPNVSSTKVENGKNREAIFTIFRHLSGASRRSNGVIELTLIYL